MADTRLTLDELVVGPGNELAIRAARGVAEAPGGVYNPLVILGARGVGKSQLLQALARHTLLCEPARSVLFEGCERLIDLVTTSVARGTLPSLRDALAGVDLLLIDDLDRLVGMPTSQGEATEIFARMLDEGRQIVVAMATSEVAQLPSGMRELLARGLEVEIEPLGVDGREEVIRRVLQARELHLDDDIVHRLARSSSSDLGELVRTVERLRERVARSGSAVSIDDLYSVLGEAVVDPDDEFRSFVDEITQSLGAVVETAPWRRRIAAAIVQWEAKGVRTRRLEAALGADTPPDVDELLERFSRDAVRLLELREAIGTRLDGAAIDDPDELAVAESLLQAPPPAAPDRYGEAAPAPGDSIPDLDPAFLDPERVILDWVGVDERIVGEGLR